MSADENYLDLFLVQPLELFGYVGSSRIAGQYAIVEVSSYEKQVWPILKGKIDWDIERVLKVSFPLEPSRTVLGCGGVEMVVSREKHMNRHCPLSSQTTRTVRLLAQPLGSILNLEAVEPETF